MRVLKRNMKNIFTAVFYLLMNLVPGKKYLSKVLAGICGGHAFSIDGGSGVNKGGNNCIIREVNFSGASKNGKYNKFGMSDVSKGKKYDNIGLQIHIDKGKREYLPGTVWLSDSYREIRQSQKSLYKDTG